MAFAQNWIWTSNVMASSKSIDIIQKLYSRTIGTGIRHMNVEQKSKGEQ